MLVSVDRLYEALRAGEVDGQENPLVVCEENRLYEICGYVSITNHMWSGFNQMAHLPTWRRLPADVQTAIERNVTKYVRLQRQDQEMANSTLRALSVFQPSSAG